MIKVVFSSLEFLFVFFPIFFVLYIMVPKRFQNPVIVLGSFAFYAYGAKETPEYILLLAFSILLNYSLGHCLGKGRTRDIFYIIIGLVFNIGPLIWFKLHINDFLLPIGISFFTFQNLSYLFDVKRGAVQPSESLIDYAVYICMFPQLIAGPIITYHQIEEQLHHRSMSAKGMKEGFSLFVLGLGSKVLIANRVGNLWYQINGIGFDSISTPLAWMGVLAFSLQIYFDFCGYSLMAMGLGSVLGFCYPKNFDHPYCAVSMTEFYRKWHMTLGNWFRDYVYIPLGGNRKGAFRTILNLFLVWMLTGLWHGFHWNFLAWGLAIAVLISLEKLFLIRILTKHRFLGHLYVIAVIPIMWLVFEVTEWKDFLWYLSRLFPLTGNYDGAFQGDFVKYLWLYGIFLALGILFCTKLPAKIWKKYENTIWQKLILVLIFVASLYCIYMGMNDPFLYFRF